MRLKVQAKLRIWISFKAICVKIYFGDYLFVIHNIYYIYDTSIWIVEDKVDTYALNMFNDEWPRGYDAHFFSNIFHDWSWSTCQLLAKKSFCALPSGGKIHRKFKSLKFFPLNSRIYICESIILIRDDINTILWYFICHSGGIK